MTAAKDNNEVREIGVEWALRQAEDLLAHGVPAIHFYVMQSSQAIKMLMGRLKLSERWPSRARTWGGTGALRDRRAHAVTD